MAGFIALTKMSVIFITVINVQVNGVDDTIKILLVIQCGEAKNAISHVGVMKTFLRLFEVKRSQ